MGWCSATEIFDTVADELLQLLTRNISEEASIRSALKNIIVTLEDMDWDCQQESGYWDEPLVAGIFQELHPDWFIWEGEDGFN